MNPFPNSKRSSISSAFAFRFNQLRCPVLPSLTAGVLTPRLSSRGDEVAAGVSAVARRSGSPSRGGDLCAGQRAPFPASLSLSVCLLCAALFPFSSARPFSFQHYFNNAQKNKIKNTKSGVVTPKAKTSRKNSKMIDKKRKNIKTDFFFSFLFINYRKKRKNSSQKKTQNSSAKLPKQRAEICTQQENVFVRRLRI